MSQEILHQATNLSGSGGVVQPQKRNRFRIKFEDPADPAVDLITLSIQALTVDMDLQDYYLCVRFEQPENEPVNFYYGVGIYGLTATVESLDANDVVTSTIEMKMLDLKEHRAGYDVTSAEVVYVDCRWEFQGWDIT